MDTLNYIFKKFNIIVGKQYYIDIPQMVGSVDLAKLLAELKLNKGAEVGVDRGEYSEILCKANPNLHLYSIDPWVDSVYEDGIPDKSADFESYYQETVKRLAPYNCTIVRKTSMEALKDFKDNSLDFVYIDANHDFLNFTMDLHHWLKKVRPGGIIAGHDFAYFSYRKFNHVKRALLAYARSYRMIPLFAVMHNPHGIKRDRFRSWFYVKPNNA